VFTITCLVLLGEDTASGDDEVVVGEHEGVLELTDNVHQRLADISTPTIQQNIQVMYVRVTLPSPSKMVI
jgi:hypothetical protein